MYSAISGQAAIFKQMQVIANNLANMTTQGFKAERVLFEQKLNDNMNQVLVAAREGDEPNRLNSIEFVEATGTVTDLSQGSTQITGNPLDVAIQGEGFFVLSTPEGERYTRDGSFGLDQTGRLVNQSGFPVQGDGGDITITERPIQIEQDGRVIANGQTVGTLRLVNAKATDLLREEGLRFRLKEGASSTEVEAPQFLAGSIESSNVNAVRELTDMMQAARLYEALQKTQDSNGRMSRSRNEAFGRS
jgi:flagellar basal-body rod protein FlgF